MAIQNLSNLIETVLKEETHGKRIYLLGTAEYGPTNQPIKIKTSAGLRAKFGTIGTLCDAWHAVKSSNKNNEIYVVKVSGRHGACYFHVNDVGGSILQDAVVITSKESNEIYNDVKIKLTEEEMCFYFPDHFPVAKIAYSFNEYRTVGSLVDAINYDTRQGRNFLTATCSCDPFILSRYAFHTVNKEWSYLYGAQCGLDPSKSALYHYLSEAYALLEGVEMDVVVPVGAFVDDVEPELPSPLLYGEATYLGAADYLTEDFQGNKRSYLNQVINFCLLQNQVGIVTMGVLGMNPVYKKSIGYLAEDDGICEHFISAMKQNLALCDNPFYSFLVSVVAGDLYYGGKNLQDNGYLAYAALCANTMYTRGTTNVAYQKNIQLMQEFSDVALEAMGNAGILAFRHSPLHDAVVVYHGVTASSEHEGLKNFPNARMIQLVIAKLRQLYDVFIGENLVELVESGDFETAVTAVLSWLAKKNILTNYEFSMHPRYYEMDVMVYLRLETIYTLKPICLCSSLRRTESKEE